MNPSLNPLHTSLSLSNFSLGYSCFFFTGARTQIKDDKVRHLQHASDFPSDVTLTRSVNTNEIKNNPVTKSDISARMDTLCTSKKIPKVNITRKKIEPIDMSQHLLGVLPTMTCVIVIRNYLQALCTLMMLHLQYLSQNTFTMVQEVLRIIFNLQLWN